MENLLLDDQPAKIEPNTLILPTAKINTTGLKVDLIAMGPYREGGPIKVIHKQHHGLPLWITTELMRPLDRLNYK